MLKVASRGDLEVIAGRRPSAAPAPAAPPAPVDIPSSQPAAGPDITRLQECMEDLVIGMIRTNELVAQQALVAAQPSKPKKLEAVVHRDLNGRMERIIINVI